jgi:hypothetical protein
MRGGTSRREYCLAVGKFGVKALALVTTSSVFVKFTQQSSPLQQRLQDVIGSHEMAGSLGCKVRHDAARDRNLSGHLQRDDLTFVSRNGIVTILGQGTSK